MYTFKYLYVVGDTKSGPPRGKTMIWRAQMALYLVAMARPGLLIEVETKGTSTWL